MSPARTAAATTTTAITMDREPASSAIGTLPNHYESYLWGLNIYPRLTEVCQRLHEEIAKLRQLSGREEGAESEIRLNIYLLACAVSDAVDDEFAGHSYDFGKITGALPFAAPLTNALGKALLVPEKRRARKMGSLRKWREEWEVAVVEYIRAALLEGGPAALDVEVTAQRLAGLCPRDGFFFDRRAKAPAAFRSQDLTHFDAAQLAGRFAGEIAARNRKILIVGCRTAGSYFAPVARAKMALLGFDHVESVTIRPKNPLSTRELATVQRAAAANAIVALIDEPVNTGSTVIKAIQSLERAGVRKENIVVLLPIHPHRKDWEDTADAVALKTIPMVLLKPEDWYKHQRLEPDFVRETLLRSAPAAFPSIDSVTLSPHENSWLQQTSEQKFHSRLKRVFRVTGRDSAGRPFSRLVFAKSTGWGWYSYGAFFAADRLSGKVPAMFGLRDGILLSEWKEQGALANRGIDRGAMPKAAGSYVAARVERLRLAEDPAPQMGLRGQHKGMEEIAGILSRAFGSKGVSFLRRPQLLKHLCQVPCPVPTMIDGKMRVSEWVGGATPLKTDFEHHGLGKTELSITDPAYDLADTALHWRLTPAEEQEMLDQYRRQTGDLRVEQRLFLYKLLAGHWNMSRMLDCLSDPRLAARHPEYSEEYLKALSFLVEHTARYCGARCGHPATEGVRPPLVFLDIDGVIDQQVFGYPSTTANGIRAMSLLNRHGFTTVINSARCFSEAKVYAEAYGCAGAIAEYGSIVFHGPSGQRAVLVSDESAAQIAQLRKVLQQIPGVYLDERYEQIIRAFLYEKGVTVPVPGSIVKNALASMDSSRLRLYQTFTDSTIVPREVNKGEGLLAWVKMAGCPEADTIAVGDSEPDLAMFRAAKASFAPSHISCKAAAKLMGARVASSSYQNGFLECVRRIVHPDGAQCPKCEGREAEASERDPFFEMLAVADQSKMKLALRALLDFRSLEAFRK